MTDAEIEVVSKLVDLCRLKGVRNLEVAGCKIELEPAQPKPEAQKPTTDPDMCRCGHAEFAHTNGLCVHGCESEKCEDKPEAP